MINNGQNLVRVRPTKLGVQIVRVDERQEVDVIDLCNTLDLSHLDVQQLHEGAVLAMTQLVGVSDGGLRNAEPLGDVRLRERARNAVRIGMSTQWNEKVLPLGGTHRVSECLRAIGGRLNSECESANRFAHFAKSTPTRENPGKIDRATGCGERAGTCVQVYGLPEQVTATAELSAPLR